MLRTKIVATIGPASDSEEVMGRLVDAGMNVARINFSHGSKREASKRVKRLRKVAAAKGKTIAILGDLQGPKIRIGRIPNDEVSLQVGEQLTLSARTDEDDPNAIPFPHPEIVEAVPQGARLVMGDGEMILKVLANREQRLYCAAQVAGKLGSRKGVSIPNVVLPIDSVTEKDREDIITIVDLELDYVALSFVRSAADIHLLRSLIEERGGKIPIIAKIEKSEAIECLLEIRDAADGMMVARGDLGLDMPTYEVPFLQKRIIRVCNEVGKPVITATQMLQSMTEFPFPTRAEATDVANAILDGTDAVMLSAETAMGNFPVKSVEMMRSIADRAESQFPYDAWNDRRYKQLSSHGTVTGDAISSATCGVAQHLQVDAIVTTTVSGGTARQVARWRPRQRIVALTPKLKTRQQLALVWGVETIHVTRFGTIDEMTEDISETLIENGFENGNTVIITAGVPFGRTGLTNMLQIHVVAA